MKVYILIFNKKYIFSLITIDVTLHLPIDFILVYFMIRISIYKPQAVYISVINRFIFSSLIRYVYNVVFLLLACALYSYFSERRTMHETSSHLCRIIHILVILSRFFWKEMENAFDLLVNSFSKRCFVCHGFFSFVIIFFGRIYLSISNTFKT